MRRCVTNIVTGCRVFDIVWLSSLYNSRLGKEGKGTESTEEYRDLFEGKYCFFFLIVFTTYHRTLYFVVYLEVIFLSSNNPTYLYRAPISTICRSCAEIFSCSPMFIDGVLYFF